jgi:hypothetical protein
LSIPQLFIEGNHRTGALVMSHVLATEGYPPFVLTVENARGYFDLSSVIAGTRKNSLGMAWRWPFVLRRLVQFLRKAIPLESKVDRQVGTPGSPNEPQFEEDHLR